MNHTTSESGSSIHDLVSVRCLGLSQCIHWSHAGPGILISQDHILVPSLSNYMLDLIRMYQRSITPHLRVDRAFMTLYQSVAWDCHSAFTGHTLDLGS